MESEAGSSTPVRSRRLARELVLKALYQMGIGGASLPEAMEGAVGEENVHADTLAFAQGLLEGVAEHREELDGLYLPYLASGWGPDRLAFIDRQVLRLAVYELYYLPGMPPKVTIDQAVSLAKRFGSAESGRFVNGVLGSVLPASPKADWTPDREDVYEEAVDETAEAETEPEVEVVREGSEEYEELKNAGGWILRREGS